MTSDSDDFVVKNMKRYERIGWKKESVGLDSRIATYRSSEDLPKTWVRRPEAIAFSADMLAISHLLYGNEEDAQDFGRRAILNASKYLLHQWPPDELAKVVAGTHSFPWMNAFEAAIRWGAPLRQWDALRDIGAAITPYHRRDGNFTAGEHCLYVAFASWLRDDSVKETNRLVEQLTESKEGLVAALGRSLSCIAQADADGCAAHLTDHLNRHRKSAGFKERLITKAVSAGGTFVYHFARRKSLDLQLKPQSSDLIVGEIKNT